jgi:hypothetical protein
MRAALLGAVCAFVVALGVAPARGEDKAAAKPAAAAAKEDKAARKPAAGEVTLSGEMVCGKCVLHETKKCQNVLKVTEAGSETKYYLADNKVAKDNHEQVCSGTAKATVTGKVKEKDGKKLLTASTIKYE